MLDENVKQTLRSVLEEKLEVVEYEREALGKFKRQVAEHDEQIRAIKMLLGDEQAETSHNRVPPDSLQVNPITPRPGTVTDEIRRILEDDPDISSTEGIGRVLSRHPRSRISPQSWSQWMNYFRTGRYRMDPTAYRRRYGQEPPYQ